MSGRPMLPDDPVPSMFAVPIGSEVQQRTIPEYKTILELFEFDIIVYTHNLDILFNIQQALKQIIISRNKTIISSRNFPSSVYDWIKVDRFQYKAIFVSTEHIYYEVLCKVKCAYQESYLS